MFSHLKNALQAFAASHHQDAAADAFRIDLPPDRKLGDVTINIFPAVKAMGMKPDILGTSLLEYMQSQDFVVDGNIERGFVNLFVTDEVYAQALSEWSLPDFAPRNERVVVDYIGANIGKPLHIGHLCTPLFGQATINLLQTMGYDVTSDMHQGDWGGIFGKLIMGWKYFGDEEKFEADPVNHLLQIYIQITEKIETEEKAKTTRLQEGGADKPEGNEEDLITGNNSTEQECRDAFKKLSEGDPASIQLWQRFTDKSLAGVRTMMAEFGVKPDIWIGESFYEGLPLPKLGDWPDLTPEMTMSSVVEELIAAGIATKNDDNSVGIVFDGEDRGSSTGSDREFIERQKTEKNEQGKMKNAGMINGNTEARKYSDNQINLASSVNLESQINLSELRSSQPKLPSCILQKRDGTHGYLASDLASIKYRMRHWSPSRILYFVDKRQELHFKQVFATAKMAWEKTQTTELTHAMNGFVSLADGAMSTRHGRVIFLRDLVRESYDRVASILQERAKTLSDSDTKSVALGAIVYSFLAQDRERDWIFDWDKVLAFEGNSGPYLQYTYVRWQKILEENGGTVRDEEGQKGRNEEMKKGDRDQKGNFEKLKHGGTDILTSFDRECITDILTFNDIILQCGSTYKFHLLINHLAQMARHLNALYVNTGKIRDISNDERIMRLEIVQKNLQIIEFACRIVGIPLPEEM